MTPLKTLLSLIARSWPLRHLKSTDSGTPAEDGACRKVVDRTPDAIFLWDRRFRLRFANPAALRLLPHTTPLGRDVRDLGFPAPLAELWESRLRGALSSGTPDTVEIAWPLPLDNESHYEVLLTPERGKDGSIENVLAVARDITHRKRAESLIQDREKHVRRVLNSLFAFVGILEPNGVLIEANEAPLKAAGISREDVYGKPFWDCYWWNYDPSVQAQLKAAVETAARGEPSRYDVAVRVSNGEFVTIDFMLSPMRDDLGRVTHLIPSAVVITERKKAEEEIRARQQELQAILDHSPAAISLRDLDGRFLVVNRQWECILGINSHHLLGARLNDLLPDEASRTSREAFDQVLRQETPQQREMEIPGIDGPRNYYLTWFPLKNHEGKIVSIGTIASDITTQKRAEREKLEMEMREKAAQETSLLKSQFLANMSHEIRTPLNGVIGMADLLLRSKLEGEHKEYVEAIRASADSLLAVVNDILDISKIEAGKMDFVVEDFSLHRIIGDVEKSFRHAARKKKLVLSAEIAADVPDFFRGDSGRLRQVLNNLTDNAIKFTHQGGVRLLVTQGAREDSQRRLQFEIRDTGIGMSPAVVSRLFSPFTQGDASLTRRYGGSGLGLSICKHIVEKLQGSIEVTSQEGHGSCFRFTVLLSTLEIPPGNGQQRSSERSAPDLLRPARILVAEDHPVNQLIAIRTLQVMGHQVDAVSDGKEALQRLQTALQDHPYDLLITDCQMPELNGFDLTAWIRSSEDPRLRNLPVLAFTAGAMKGDAEKCLAAGMDDYIIKPITVESLELQVRRWLSTADPLKAVPSPESTLD